MPGQRVRARPTSSGCRPPEPGPPPGQRQADLGLAPLPDGARAPSEEPEPLQLRSIRLPHVERAAGIHEVLEVGVDLEGLVDGIGLGVAGEVDQALESLHATRCQVHRDALEPGPAGPAGAGARGVAVARRGTAGPATGSARAGFGSFGLRRHPRYLQTGGRPPGPADLSTLHHRGKRTPEPHSLCTVNAICMTYITSGYGVHVTKLRTPAA